jgi:hypothetical protein
MQYVLVYYDDNVIYPTGKWYIDRNGDLHIECKRKKWIPNLSFFCDYYHDRMLEISVINDCKQK